MDKDTLFWLFSTAPQVLAAIIGIVFTGMFFMSGNIDSRVREDETLSEIGEKAKTIMHSNMKIIAVTNVIAIIVDLIMLAFTPSLTDNWNCCSFRCVGFFAVVNLAAIIVTFYFVFDVVSPKYFDRIANNLSQDFQEGSVDPYEYVRNYSAFDKAARDKLRLSQTERYIPIQEVLNMLIANGILARYDIKDFKEIRKIRNLILHGHNQKVSKDLNDELIRITAKVVNG